MELGGEGAQAAEKVGSVKEGGEMPPSVRNCPGVRALSQRIAVSMGGAEGRKTRGAERLVDAP